MNCAYSTNIGVRRKVNQDACLAGTIYRSGKDYYVFAAADGVGGHKSGEVASEMAINYIKNHLYEVSDYFFRQGMYDFLNVINQEIRKSSQENPDWDGMATTLTLCILDEKRISISQIGDSRAYLINQNGITQLTKDHSLVQILLDNGKITKSDARNHPQKNIVTRTLGSDKQAKVDFFTYDIRKDDIFLVCTDGLYNMVSEEEIYEIIMNNSLENAVEELVDLANENGGNDNITVLIFSQTER